MKLITPLFLKWVIFITFFSIYSNLLFGQASEVLNKQVKIINTNGTLQDILNELSESHNVSLSYIPEYLPLTKKVHIPETNQSVKQVLMKILAGTGIKYKLYKDQVILIQKNKCIISGYVEDAKSGERLIGATVYDLNSEKGTVTNEYGFYSFSIYEGEIILSASYIGYQLKNIKFNTEKDTTLIIKLIPGLSIDEVVIESKNLRYSLYSTDISKQKLSMVQVKNMPGIGGETDAMRVLHLMPGVQGGNEGSSGLYVRGGSPEQNLILLDGVPVYNVNHAFGFFSVFNSSAIKDISLIKGGFPARYGGRLSSVVDVRMKEGNNREFHGSASLGVVSSKLMFEGPIKKEKGSFLFSARRSVFDIVLLSAVEDKNEFPLFSFYDINLKANYQITNKDRIFFSSYIGQDHLDYFEEVHEYYENYDLEYYYNYNSMDSDWGNITSVLRWNHSFNNKLFCNTTLFYSKYKLILKVLEDDLYDESFERSDLNYGSGIESVGSKIKFDYHPNINHAIKFGINHSYHSFNPGNHIVIAESYYTTFDPPQNDPAYEYNHIDIENDWKYTNELSTYLEDDMNISNSFKTNIGIHSSAFILPDKLYYSIEPRLSFRYLINKNLSLKTAYSKMQQYFHLLTFSSFGLPTDLWLPVTKDIKPQKSNQYTLGMVYIYNNEWEIEIEGFYKDFKNIYEYKEGADYVAANNSWEQNVAMGIGWSYGSEIIMKKNSDKTSGWISYTLSKTERKFDEINNGNIFPYKYDRRHNLNLVVNHQITPKTGLNFTWVYYSGSAFSLLTQEFLSFNNIFRLNHPHDSQSLSSAQYLRGKNSYRLPAYHRLDVSFCFKKIRNKSESKWNIGIYNVYNRANPFIVHKEETRIKQVSLIRIMPFINYEYSF